jgi:hypothetical protein
MEDMIAEMQTKLTVGGQQMEEAEREMATKHRQAQLKLKKQRKQAKALAEDKAKQEEEMLDM